MMGSVLSRALLMVFGYAYPAYRCFKAVDKKNKPETEHLLFWCQYWSLVAMFSVGERLGDPFISWLPMYSEAKLAFLIYLWYPKTKGTAYVYDSWVQPYIAKHETQIDHKLSELNGKASEIGLLIWQKAEGYGQTRFLEIMHYFSLGPSSPPAHYEQLPLDSATDSANQMQSEHFLPDSFSQSLSSKNNEQAQEAGHSPTSAFSPPKSAQSSENVTPDQFATDLEIEPVSIPKSRNRNSSDQETVHKRFFRQTCGKWKIFRAAAHR